MNATRRDLYDDPRRNERDLPYIVEIASTADDRIGPKLWDILDFHQKRFIEERSGHKRHEIRPGGEWVEYIRFCFKEQRDAEDFKALFGGAIVTPSVKRRRA